MRVGYLLFTLICLDCFDFVYSVDVYAFVRYLEDSWFRCAGCVICLLAGDVWCLQGCGCTFMVSVVVLWCLLLYFLCG